ncbi:hypothetical protein [Streptomyces phaeoluteigriseus]|uniref:hypothetical protein n=1 Tax=Streptomyces phaeoluteigriseus TaxID=114686 RepID=UPI0036C544F0
MPEAAAATRGRPVGAVFHTTHRAQRTGRELAAICVEFEFAFPGPWGAVGHQPDGAAARAFNADLAREMVQARAGRPEPESPLRQ